MFDLSPHARYRAVMTRALAPTVLVIASAVLLCGCISFERTAGVEASWRDEPAPELQEGRTTEAEILAWLGPPSQLIALGERTVFYYLRETTKGSTAITLVYNRQRERVSYERAAFFFDADGVLTEYAFGPVATPE
jgi:hypothetical protein